MAVMQLCPKRIVHIHLIQSLFHSLGLLQTKKFRMGIQCQHLYKGLKVRERTITSKSLAKKLHTCFSVDITWNVFCTWSISSTAQHAPAKIFLTFKF